MGMMRAVSVIFDTGTTYLFFFKKGYLVDLEKKIFPKIFKAFLKALIIYGFVIVDYFVRGEREFVLLRSGIRNIIFLDYEIIYVSFPRKSNIHQKYKRVSS